MSLSAEQLEQRKSFVGASESPCLVGVSPFGTIHSVWSEKMGLVLDDPTDAMKAGNYLEEGLGRWYADETKHQVAGFGSVVHPKYSFMGCTPDLCIFGERRIAQIKLVGQWMAHHWDEDVPEYVRVQVQHEMEVCDADACDVIALIGGTDFRIIPVERDRAMGADLVDICRDFWTRFVVPRELPPIDESLHAKAMLDALYRKPTKALLPATPEADAIARAWLLADDLLGDAEKARQGLTNKMKALIGESEGIDGDFYRARWAKTVKSRTFTLKPIQLKKARAA